MSDQRFGDDRRITPRLLRLKDTPRYLGIDKNTFNRDVRPQLAEIRTGRAVRFDRKELDRYADALVESARVASGSQEIRRITCDQSGKSQDCGTETEFGISLRLSDSPEEAKQRFRKVLAAVISR